MPQALPVGRLHFVQYLRTEPTAPRREPARVTEVKGRKRTGTGVVYRLFGHHAVVLGRWSQMTVQERVRAARERADDLDAWGRLIGAEEADDLARQFAGRKIREGWIPPWWHWRRYWGIFMALVHRGGFGEVVAYNEIRWTLMRPLKRLWRRPRPDLRVVTPDEEE